MASRTSVSAMATTRVLWLLVLLLALPARAGDYYLFVADGATCSSSPSLGERRSSKAVIADLSRYFNGIAPQIPVFEAAMRNGSVGFCSPTERVALEDALISWVMRGPPQHELYLYDFLKMLGSQRVADDLAARLAVAKEADLRDRLTRAREAVRRGVKVRGG